MLWIGKLMKTKIHLIAAGLCYLAAIVFWISAVIGKSTLFVTVGALWMCIGTQSVSWLQKCYRQES
jgi:hypothetical protein